MRRKKKEIKRKEEEGVVGKIEVIEAEKPIAELKPSSKNLKNKKRVLSVSSAKPKQNKKWVTAGEFAKAVDVDKAYVNRLIRNGTIEKKSIKKEGNKNLILWSEAYKQFEKRKQPRTKLLKSELPNAQQINDVLLLAKKKLENDDLVDIEWFIKSTENFAMQGRFQGAVALAHIVEKVASARNKAHKYSLLKLEYERKQMLLEVERRALITKDEFSLAVQEVLEVVNQGLDLLPQTMLNKIGEVMGKRIKSEDNAKLFDAYNNAKNNIKTTIINIAKEAVHTKNEKAN